MLPAAEPRPGPTMILIFLSVIDKVPDDEEVFHIAHDFQSVDKLVLQSLAADLQVLPLLPPDNALPAPSDRASEGIHGLVMSLRRPGNPAGAYSPKCEGHIAPLGDLVPCYRIASGT